MNTLSDRIKIIQLTDCHLLASPDERLNGSNTATTLQKTLHYISNNEENVDLFLLSGDLSQDGSEMSYRRLSQLCSEINNPIHALPGNHDNFNSMQSIFKHPISCNKYIDLGHWRILLVDSTQKNKTPGRISITELEWLQEELARHKHKFTLIAMHHYPLPTKSQWLDELGLENSNEFLQLIQHHPQVKTVTSGHIHQSLCQSYKGIHIMSAPSSCFQFKPNSPQFELDSQAPGYRWLELEQNGHITTGVTHIEPY